jgi:hypothetical protein
MFIAEKEAISLSGQGLEQPGPQLRIAGMERGDKAQHNSIVGLQQQATGDSQEWMGIWERSAHCAM